MLILDDPSTVIDPTGFIVHPSLFGFLLLPLALVALFCVIRNVYLLVKTRKKSHYFWLTGWIVFLVLLYFFGKEFLLRDIYPDEGKLYGIVFIWLYLFLIFNFWREEKRKLMVTVLVIAILTTPFLVYAMFPKESRHFSLLEEAKIPVPFTEKCVDFMTTTDYGKTCLWDIHGPAFSVF